MTLANKITLMRIGLIPVFVVCAIYYGMGFTKGQPEEWLRWAGVLVFGVAALSDGLDGFIARKYNQRTELGVVLDPIADKGLLMAGIITLSVSGWPCGLPVWFAVLVVARDLMVVLGALVVVIFQGRTSVRTAWTGKVATALQMVTLVLVMLQFDFLKEPMAHFGRFGVWVWLDLAVVLAAGFTVFSGLEYSARAIGLLHQGGHGDPMPWPKAEKGLNFLRPEERK